MMMRRIGASAAGGLMIGLAAWDGAAAPPPLTGTCAIVVSATAVVAGASCPGLNPLAVPPGTPVLWCYQVRNETNIDLDGVAISDAILGVVPGLLDETGAGETSDFVSITGEAAFGTHAATGEGHDAFYRPLACSAGEITMIKAAPGLGLSVTATVDPCPGAAEITVDFGADVTYCHALANLDATTSLTNVAVIDDQFVPQPIATIASLAPGESRTLTAVRPVVTATTVNFVTATGTPVWSVETFPPVAAQTSVLVTTEEP
ncbi:MAG: hypothetical protein IPK66_15265 [Rhodospirillales bacterium]|nr:hypothetical protein [Rhodospirillales bacterium]